MNDRELLELAAKADGLEGYRYCANRQCMAEWVGSDGGWFGCSIWSPLTEDGHAMRLAVKLGMTVSVSIDRGETRILDADGSLVLVHMHFAGGPYAATRRAIVRAAAEIGRQMQEGGAA